MKFSEMYSNLNPMDTVQEKYLLVCHDEKPCAVCGSLTNFVDFCSEARLCSEECYERHWNRMNVVCNDFPDSIGLRSVALLVEDYSDNPSLEALANLAQKVYDSNNRNGVTSYERVFSMTVTRLYPSMPYMSAEKFAEWARESVKNIVRGHEDKNGTHARLVTLYAQLLSVAYNEFNPEKKPMLEIMKILRGTPDFMEVPPHD